MSWQMKGGQGPYKLNYNIGLEIPLRQDNGHVLLDLPAESKLFLTIFITMHREEKHLPDQYMPTRGCVNSLKQ